MDIIWLAAAIAVPLALNPWGRNAFELLKAALLLALALVAGLVALVRFIRWSASRVEMPCALPWLVRLAMAFGLALLLATILSVNPRLSLWGSYQRQQGLLTLLAGLAMVGQPAYLAVTQARGAFAPVYPPSWSISRGAAASWIGRTTCG
jgi:disulfide bond formation protein DsbB